MSDFATVQDIIDLKRALSADEQTRASALLPVVSDIIRVAGDSAGKDIDALVQESPE